MKDGKILDVDSEENVLKFKGEMTRLFDIQGRTMLPVLSMRTAMS